MAADGAVVERQVQVLLQRPVGGDVDTGDELIAVEPRHRRQGEDLAGGRCNGDDRATAPVEQLHGEFLQLAVQRQGQVAPGHRVGVAEFAQHSPARIGLDLAQPRLAVQLVLVEALHPALADEVGAGIVARIQLRQLLGVDPAHVAQGVHHGLGVGIVAQQLGLDLDTGQAMAIDRQAGDLRFVEVAHQQRRLEGSLTLARANPEGLGLLLGKLQQLDQQGQGGVQIVDPLAHQGQVVGGPVLGQQLAVAIVDQAAGRWQRLHPHPVLLGARAVDLVLHHLQVEEPPAQQPRQDQHHQHGQQRAHAEHAQLLFRILQGIAAATHAR